MRRYLFLLSLSIISIVDLQGQEDYIVSVQRIDLADGLLHRDVQALEEDQNGLIWIGTSKGLQRYDGHEFKTWDRTDKTGLLEHIISITIDAEGWLWILNEKAKELVFINSETEEILTVEERFGDRFPYGSTEVLPSYAFYFYPYNPIQKAKDGSLVFGTDNGEIYLFDKKGDFSKHKIAENGNTSPMGYDAKGNLFVRNKDKVWYKWNKEEGAEFLWELENPVISAEKILKDGDERYIMEYEQNVREEVRKGLIFNAENHEFTCSILPNFIETHNGVYWIFDQKSIELKSQKDSLRIGIIDLQEYDVVRCMETILFDSRNIAWIATDDGILKIQLKENDFQTYASFNKLSEKDFNNASRGIFVNDSLLFVNFEIEGESHSINLNSGATVNVTSNLFYPRTLTKRRNDELLIGTGNSFINLTSSEVMSFSDLIKDGSLIVGDNWSTYEDKNQTLWLNINAHIYSLAEGSQELLFETGINNTLDSINIFKNIYGIFPEGDDYFWITSQNGMFLVSIKTRKIIHSLGNFEKGEFYLPAQVYYFIHKDSDGIYWIGTDQGLIRWVGLKPLEKGGINHKPYRVFSRKDGLSNDIILAIYEDKYNRLWLSSDDGIMSFEKETFKVNVYKQEDGIAHNECNRISHFQDEEGMIYFGGMNGVTVIDPSRFTAKNYRDQQVMIANYEIYEGKNEGLVNRTSELVKSKRIDFSPDDRFFKLSFLLPDFSRKADVLYAWKIDGIYNDWVLQKDNYVQFTTLPYGSHTLKVKGQGGEGTWSPNELAIKLVIHKPFYLQWWFYLVSLLAIMSVIFGVLEYRTRFLQKEIDKATKQIQHDKRVILKQKEALEEKDRIKTKFFTNVSHELRTPLTLILGPLQSLKKEKGISKKGKTLVDRATKSGNDLLKMINSILDISKMDEGELKVNNQAVLLSPLVRRILLSFESLALEKSIRLLFDSNIDSTKLINIDSQKLERILMNLIYNAFKFTDSGGDIKLELREQESDFRIDIIDTGIGIATADLKNIFERYFMASNNRNSSQGTGIGLSLAKEYALLMGGDLLVKSEEGKGSTFSLILPLLHSEHIDSFVGNDINISSIEKEDRSGSTTENDRDNLPTVLIVEDNENIRSYMKDLLAPYYKVVLASNGVDALAKMSEEINLVVTDFMMPIMDGKEFVESVKKIEKYRNIPIMMITAKVNIQNKKNILPSEINDYIIKPFDQEELFEKVENLVNINLDMHHES